MPDRHSDADRVLPLSRRRFLHLTAAGGAAAAVTGSLSCDPAPEPAAEAATAPEPEGQAGGGGLPSFDLQEATIAELAEGMEMGRWSARSLTEAYLSRIEAVDRAGPTLRSVIETNPEALAIADRLDAERADGRARGPLHGIPILLKDNVATADRMTTTAGSYALEGSVPPRDSAVARKLREAGAVLLGKANLSEWANFRSSNSSSGWSGRGGQCRNPYALDRNPCGSSSGSGAAASANLAAAAIGTETNGSIVCPSSANGLVGVKPTVGLVSRATIVPISHSQDTAGPMTRTVRDAALVLGAIAGDDPEDPATTASRGRAHTDYVQFLDPAGLQGARIGVARGFFGFSPQVDALMEDALDAMREAGATVVEETDIDTRSEFGPASFQVLLYEFKADLNAYLTSLGPDAPVKSLAEVIEFNRRNAEREMPYFGQDLFLQAEEKGPLTENEYRDALALARRLSRREGIDAVMDEHELDAIVAPTGGPAWLTDLVNGDHFGGGSSGPAAVAGYPNVTVPAGFVFGLPVGISFFGRAWSEPVLLRIAYAYEQTSNHRRPPTFLPTVDLTV